MSLVNTEMNNLVLSRGHAVEQLVESMRYKSQDGGSLEFFIDLILLAPPPHPQQKRIPGIYSGRKRGRFIGLTTLPFSRAYCFEIWRPQPSGTLWNCSGLHRDKLQHIPTRGYNITQSSAPDNGHMVARNMLSNY